MLENIVEALSGSVGSGRDRAALALETPSLPRGRNPESPCHGDGAVLVLFDLKPRRETPVENGAKVLAVTSDAMMVDV